ncbi:MAG: NERD domain-containing protein [Actinomycetia bacterium]|nr:NERD domain-containing protein [Actinomycetes bacterium]
MSPRCLPESPTFESVAEQAVWTALRSQLPDDAVLLANLALTDRKGDCEADLVVLWPDIGMAVIEVKGGHITRGDDGTWIQVGNNDHRKVVDPIYQAHRSHYALSGFIRQRTSLMQLRMTHLVAFPYTRVDDNFASPDCPRWRLLDQLDVETNAAGKVFTALRDLEGAPAPTSEQIAAIVDALTARPGTQRVLLSTLAENEDSVERLTAKQATVLRMLSDVPRLLVRGGAGTGKSYLALEQARRLSRAGQRVALVCYSRGLASFVERRVATFPAADRPAYVGTFHNLGVQWGAKPRGGADQRYWDETLPVEMLRLAAHLTDADRFDAIVVDEAQDFADSWWPALTAGLRDPQSSGLSIFLDEGQRVFGREGVPPHALVPVNLDENLRNTKQIAQTFGSLAHEQMKYAGLDGPPVRFVACATAEAVNAADDALLALMDEGWPPESLALLTTGSRHPVQLERVKSRGTAGYWDSFWEADDAFYGHVLGFKGLERPAVVLAVNGFRDEHRARELLYVGMSRARDLLVVCGDTDELRHWAGEGVMRRLGV